MKSKSLIDSLAHMDGVKTGGDICQIISNAMLGVVRGEVSNTTLEALAKGGEAIERVMAVQCKVAITQQMLREKGVEFGKIKQMGEMIIGTPDSDQPKLS